MKPKTPPNPGCERVLAQLDRLLDDGLDPVETARDRGHLEACADCRAAMQTRQAELESVRRALAAEGLEVERAVAATVTLLDAQRLRVRRRLLRRPVLVSLTTAAAAVLLLFVLDLAGADLSSGAEAAAGPSWPPFRLAAPELGLDAIDLSSGGEAG